MKKAFLFILFLFAIGSFLIAETAVIQELSGKVEVRPPGQGWARARTGMEISGGTYVSTGFGASAVLELGGSILRVKQLTRMQLENIIEREGTLNTNLYLRVGKVRAEVRSTRGLRNNFRLRSPVSTAAVRGTIFEYDGVVLWVEDGSVVLSNLLGQSEEVSGGEESKTDKYSPPEDAEDILNQLFQTASSLSGEGGLALLPELENNALVVLTLEWD